MNLVKLKMPQYQDESLTVQALRMPPNALPSNSIPEKVQYRNTSSSHPRGSSDFAVKSILS